MLEVKNVPDCASMLPTDPEQVKLQVKPAYTSCISIRALNFEPRISQCFMKPLADVAKRQQPLPFLYSIGICPAQVSRLNARVF